MFYKDRKALNTFVRPHTILVNKNKCKHNLTVYQKTPKGPLNAITHWLICSTCEWWRAGPAAALPQQRPSAAAGKALCGSLGGRCRSLAPPVTGTWDRRS